MYSQPIVHLDTGGHSPAQRPWCDGKSLKRKNDASGRVYRNRRGERVIDVLGQYVLEASCRQLQDWKVRLPGTELSVSVNVSTKQLATEDFCDKLEAVGRDGCRAEIIDPGNHRDRPRRDDELTGSNLRRIRQKGIRVYLDDFGTGYSSLNVLNKFQLDGLKIDRSFVKAAIGLRQLAAIIQAVTDLARNLSMEVVAEGVETPEQLLLLQTLNCEKAQGYLFSPAVCVRFRGVSAPPVENPRQDEDRRGIERILSPPPPVSARDREAHIRHKQLATMGGVLLHSDLS